MTRIERFLLRHVLLTDILFFAMLSIVGVAVSLTVVVLIAFVVATLI